MSCIMCVFVCLCVCARVRERVRVRVLVNNNDQSEGVGIPRTDYFILGRGGVWGGRCRDVRRFRRRFRRFRFRRRSPGWVATVGRATHL